MIGYPVIGKQYMTKLINFHGKIVNSVYGQEY